MEPGASSALADNRIIPTLHFCFVLQTLNKIVFPKTEQRKPQGRQRPMSMNGKWQTRTHSPLVDIKTLVSHCKNDSGLNSQLLDEDDVLSEMQKSPVINVPDETAGASQLQGGPELTECPAVETVEDPPAQDGIQTQCTARAALDEDSDGVGKPSEKDPSDSFADDEDEEEGYEPTDEDSDWQPGKEDEEEEDVEELMKEAKRFMKRKK
ncbi:hypothetical protein STEG23_002154 [Scotinomys teguina]